MTTKTPIELEKEASRKNYSHDYFGASGLYEKAGDGWVRESSNTKRFEYLYNAIKDYQFADKNLGSTSPVIKKRLKQKVESINKKLTALEQEKLIRTVGGGLQRKLYAVISIITLAIALVLVSFNLTGNAIAGINPENTKWIGICFFICGLIFAFVYLKNKK